MVERTYRIQKAAELAGVSPAVIRAWERRYGVLRPRRTGGGYRAFTAADIELLRRLKQLTESGMPIGDAARLLPEIRRELKAVEAPSGVAPVALAPVAGSQVEVWRSRVVEAAARLDQREVSAVLDEVLTALPPLAAYAQVLVPIQREVGERWHQGLASVAEEHLVTHEVRVRLLSLLQGAPRLALRHVVCACFPEEDHEIGLLGAALRFRHAGWRVTYLGPRTPLEQLVATVRRLKPDVVALSCVNDSGPDPFRSTLQATVAAMPAGVRVVVGGSAIDLYRDIVDELGVERLAEEADWSALVP